MPIPKNAEVAAEGVQSSWLSIPRMTATTDSPSKMSVNSPKRSGR